MHLALLGVSAVVGTSRHFGAVVSVVGNNHTGLWRWLTGSRKNRKLIGLPERNQREEVERSLPIRLTVQTDSRRMTMKLLPWWSATLGVLIAHVVRASSWTQALALLVSLSISAPTESAGAHDLSPRAPNSPPSIAPCDTASVEELEYELWCHTLQATRLANKRNIGYVPAAPPQECYALPDPSRRRPGVERMSVEEVTTYLSTLRDRQPAVLFHSANPSANRFCTWLVTKEGVAASEAVPMGDAEWSVGSGLSSSLHVPEQESGRVAEERGFRLEVERPVSLVEAANRLLPPKVAKDLIARQVDTLIVVPIYDVGAIPFAAFPLDGKQLIDYVSVLIAPSFQSFEKPPLEWQGEALHPLVLGDPETYGYEDLPRLKHALGEAKGVAEVVGAEPLLHDDATESAIRDWLQAHPDTNLVHIAAHGIAHSEDADARSGLYLADGFWSAEDVWNLEFVPGSLVVLSACQSGLGMHFEMGTASVARAFHQDGASTVVMSLWNVDDKSTKELMVAFTKNAFKKGGAVPPDRALREAMLELRKTNPDPLHWAGFNVFGLPALN